MEISQKTKYREVIVLSIVLLDIIACLWCPKLNMKTTLMITGGFALATMIISLALIYRTTKKLNFFFIFAGTGFLFEFGQSISVFIGGYDKLSSKVLLNINYGYFTSKEIWAAFFFTHILMMCVVAAYIFCYKEEKKAPFKNVKLVNNEKKNVKLGYIFLAISLIPTFYLLIQEIVTLQTSGYGATLQAKQGIAKIFELISGLFPAAVVWLLIFEERKRGKNLILSLVCLYMVLQLVGGSRIQIFKFVLLIVLMYLIYYKTVTKKKIIIFIAAGFAGVFVLSLVSSIRIYVNTTSNLLELMVNAAGDLWKNNFIVSTIRELGNTQVLNALVYKECPEQVGFAYGTSYLKMIFSAIPKFWRGVHPSSIDVDVVFSPYYTDLCGLGSSFIAEAYWNFGILSTVFCLLLGKFFAFVDVRLYGLCKTKKEKVKIYLYFFIVFQLVFWVRSSSNEFGRSMLYAVIIMVMSQIPIRKTLCECRIKANTAAKKLKETATKIVNRIRSK